MPRDHVDIVYSHVIAGVDVGPARAEALRERAQARERISARNGNAFPDLARPELADDRRRAANVVRVAVRERDPIEAAETRGADDRRNDAIADVEAGPWREAACIDEQRRAARKDDEDRVSLPDVDDRRVQSSV